MSRRIWQLQRIKKKKKKKIEAKGHDIPPDTRENMQLQKMKICVMLVAMAAI
jgi:hypothetical protein